MCMYVYICTYAYVCMCTYVRIHMYVTAHYYIRSNSFVFHGSSNHVLIYFDLFQYFSSLHTLATYNNYDEFVMKYINCGIKSHTQYELLPYPY